MSDPHPHPPPQPDTPEEAAFNRQQFQDAKNLGQITCDCGTTVPLRFAYRCYYCDGYFCIDCAAEHFGMTRAEWQEKQREEEREGAGETNSS